MYPEELVKRKQEEEARAALAAYEDGWYYSGLEEEAWEESDMANMDFGSAEVFHMETQDGEAEGTGFLPTDDGPSSFFSKFPNAPQQPYQGQRYGQGQQYYGQQNTYAPRVPPPMNQQYTQAAP